VSRSPQSSSLPMGRAKRQGESNLRILFLALSAESRGPIGKIASHLVSELQILNCDVSLGAMTKRALPYCDTFRIDFLNSDERNPKSERAILTYLSSRRRRIGPLSHETYRCY
jgi:hypothetical protein